MVAGRDGHRPTCRPPNAHDGQPVGLGCPRRKHKPIPVGAGRATADGGKDPFAGILQNLPGPSPSGMLARRVGKALPASRLHHSRHCGPQRRGGSMVEVDHRLFHFEEFDEEVERGVGGNRPAGRAAGTVAKFARDEQFDHATLTDQLHALGPAGDHAI